MEIPYKSEKYDQKQDQSASAKRSFRTFMNSLDRDTSARLTSYDLELCPLVESEGIELASGGFMVASVRISKGDKFQILLNEEMRSKLRNVVQEKHLTAASALKSFEQKIPSLVSEFDDRRSEFRALGML